MMKKIMTSLFLIALASQLFAQDDENYVCPSSINCTLINRTDSCRPSADGSHEFDTIKAIGLLKPGLYRFFVARADYDAPPSLHGCEYRSYQSATEVRGFFLTTGKNLMLYPNYDIDRYGWTILGNQASCTTFNETGDPRNCVFTTRPMMKHPQ